MLETVEAGGQKVERPKSTPYDPRHFYASMLVEKLVNLKRLQTLMGPRKDQDHSECLRAPR
jgi:integrase